MYDVDPIKIAVNALLAPADLTTRTLEKVVAQAMGRSVDYVDIFLQASYEEHWLLEESIIKHADFSTNRGFGYRVVSGEKTGFAYGESINQKALQQAAKAARSIASHRQVGKLKIAPHVSGNTLYLPINPIQTFPDAEKVNLLKCLDQYARDKDPRVQQVILELSGHYEVVLIANNRGHIAADLRPLVSLNVKVVAVENNRVEIGSAGGGGRLGYEIFLKEGFHYIDKAVRQACQNFLAEPAPPGIMPVVLGPGWPGVLLHEAIGHGLEGDFNRKGSSAFAGRLGETIASPLCTIVDDGTLPHRRGSLTMDDEGTPSQKTVLIERGVLKNYLQDQHNAHLMGMQSTGNGRRESYAHLPIPRMTNTYLLAGESNPSEIISSVERGLYAVDFSGGQVDITSGKFVFSTSEAYLIEKGKITKPVKGATLTGDGPSVLKLVSMVGNDLAQDAGLGTCGKEGQSVPVGVGQPTLKLEALTVGGMNVS